MDLPTATIGSLLPDAVGGRPPSSIRNRRWPLAAWSGLALVFPMVLTAARVALGALGSALLWAAADRGDAIGSGLVADGRRRAYGQRGHRSA